MNSAHCLLDAHPYNENIVLSADGEGLICIWDILKGYLIKVFLERGFHMRLPNLEM
jgi:bromodomain and WD repeat domain-containing protein 1/3